MINKDDIKKYRNVVAPLGLKDRVVKAVDSVGKKKSRFSMKKTVSVAACFLILFVGIAVFCNPTSPVDVIAEGSENISIISQALSRDINPCIATIRLYSEGRIKVKPQGDGFYLLDSKDYDFIPLNRAKIFNKKEVVIGWDITQKKSEISINGDLYEIFASGDANSVTIIKSKK